MSAVLTTAQVRQRIDKAIEAGGFKPSRYVPELFGYDVRQLAHQSYAVGTPSTELKTFDDRDGLDLDEGEAITLVQIRTAFRLRGDAQLQDYDAALVHEQEVLKAALAVDPTYLHARPLGITRQVTDTGEWVISDIRLRAWHRYSFVEGL